MNILTTTETATLEHCETVIDRGLKTFYDVGTALATIRDQRLYRHNYTTFEDYCQQRWQMTRMRASHLIAAATVVENVNHGLQGIPAPENERQIRPLTALEPDQQRDVWHQAVETAPNGKVTATHVKLVRDAYLADEPLDSYEQTLVDNGVVHYDPVSIVHKPIDSVEWYTPGRYIDAVRAVMGGIDTDPATDEQAQQTVQATTYYTVHTDGFDKPWRGRVWLNPPYGMANGKAVASQWAERLIGQYRGGITTQAILLVNAVIDSKWFNALWQFPICFTNHRIRFDLPAHSPEDANTSPVIGSAFVYLGPHVAAFVREFSQFGTVVARLHTYDDHILTEMEVRHVEHNAY